MDKIPWITLIALLMSIALEYYGVWKHNDIGIFTGALLAVTNMGILTKD